MASDSPGWKRTIFASDSYNSNREGSNRTLNMFLITPWLTG